ncbi:MAG: hypothetical protein DI598_15190 [Pseudopedobacter saltans]|uniref:Phosphatidic acid phosphatase type 2/haloperoxidase domain-containing protein n=1 Tax=Pseudopedobacter saltans TaxID=151895 RepID=A0A2W5ERH8_9SPHI|nr:MAG: hypothetical protein DI598_15190 [Pseudopedobacter saltans]
MLLNAKRTNLFFVYFALWLITISSLLCLVSKYELFALINHHRCTIADYIFSFFTELGSGYVLIPMLFYFLYKKNYRLIINLAVILIVNSLLVSWLKHYFYESRPLLAYGRSVVETAPWTTLYEKYSFPSGHTSLAFAIGTYLSLVFKNNYLKIICFASACLIGYSRVYLGEHFPIDVCCGSILGLSVACIYYFLVNNYLSKRFRKEPKTLSSFVETVG